MDVQDGVCAVEAGQRREIAFSVLAQPVPRADSEVYRAQPLAGGELGSRRPRSFSYCGAERHRHHPVTDSSDIK